MRAGRRQPNTRSPTGLAERLVALPDGGQQHQGEHEHDQASQPHAATLPRRIRAPLPSPRPPAAGSRLDLGPAPSRAPPTDASDDDARRTPAASPPCRRVGGRWRTGRRRAPAARASRSMWWADRPEDAEAVDDLVGHEGGVGVAGPAVLVVVVALAALDVVGQRLRARRCRRRRSGRRCRPRGCRPCRRTSGTGRACGPGRSVPSPT